MRAAAIIGIVVAAIAAAPARADTIVVLPRAAAAPVVAVPVAPKLGIWRVPDRVAARLPHVLAAGPDRQVHRLSADVATADPLAPSEWWLAAVGADKAAPPPGGKLVAVVDTGVDSTHPELSATDVLLLNAQRTTPGPEEHHGTAVASIVGAPADGKGMQGVYPGAALASYDAGGQTLSDVLSGIGTALLQPGPGVINLSVGFEGAAGASLLGYAVDSAVAAGWLVVAAAGNGGDRGSPVTYPADLPHVLTVAAADRTGHVPAFSSHSPHVDLAAPGVGILAAVPTWKDPSGFASLTGTSFAAPIVSGAAAWLWTGRPLLDNTQVFEMLRRSAIDLEELGYDSESGFGLLDIPAALQMRAPIRDPQEPNDDITLVADDGLFSIGTPALVDADRRSTRVAARVDRYDDPADVYRAFVPAGSELVVSVERGPVRLGLWGPKTTSVRERGKPRTRDLLANGAKVRTHAVGRRGEYYYVAVTPKRGVRAGSYLLSLSLRAGR